MNNFKKEWKKLSASRLAKCLDNERLAFLFDFILNSGNKHRSYTRLAIRAFRQLTGDLAKQAHAFLDENIAIARSDKCRHEHIFTLVILSREFGFSQQSANFCKTQLKTQHHNLIDYFFYLYAMRQYDASDLQRLQSYIPHWAALDDWSDLLSGIAVIDTGIVIRDAWSPALLNMDNSAEVLRYLAKHGLGNFDGCDGLPHDNIVQLLQQNFKYVQWCQQEIFTWWDKECREFEEDDDYYYETDIIDDAIGFVRILKSDAQPMRSGLQKCLDIYINDELDCYQDEIYKKLIAIGCKVNKNNLLNDFKQALRQPPSAFVINNPEYDEEMPEIWYEPNSRIFKLIKALRWIDSNA